MLKVNLSSFDTACVETATWEALEITHCIKQEVIV